MPTYSRLRLNIFVIWAAFLIRGCFYATLLPLWEGYDEYAHFAYVEQLVISKRPLVNRKQPVPPDVAASLQLSPLPWELRSFSPPAVGTPIIFSSCRHRGCILAVIYKRNIITH